MPIITTIITIIWETIFETLSHQNLELSDQIGLKPNPILSEKGGEDKSRVGASENALLGSSDLSTIIGPGTGKVLTISSA